MSATLGHPSEEPTDDQPGLDPEAPWRLYVTDFFASKVAICAFVVLVLIIIIALIAPLISPENPYALAMVDALNSRLPPGAENLNGRIFWLGTDDAGRDLLSAILYGLRTSLSVGVISGIIALVIGVVTGLAAVYFGGRIDTLIMRIVGFQLNFPALLVAITLLAILGKGLDNTIIALAIIQWAYYATTLRDNAMIEYRKDYIQTAACLALSRRRIVFHHLLPNCLPPLIVIGILQTANAITLEATVSFLGIGLPVTQPSLGLLIANGFEYLLNGEYWISFFPGIVLLLTIFSINLVGQHLRDVVDPPSAS